MENAAEAAEILERRTYAEWLEVLEGVRGQWAAVQNSWEVGQDPALRADGLIAPVVDADGQPRPVRRDPSPAAARPGSPSTPTRCRASRAGATTS